MPGTSTAARAWLRYRESPEPAYLAQALVAHFTGHLLVATAMRPHRGIGEANAFTRDGRLVASFTQENMIRGLDEAAKRMGPATGL